jgi:hypothetical protein
MPTYTEPEKDNLETTKRLVEIAKYVQGEVLPDHFDTVFNAIVRAEYVENLNQKLKDGRVDIKALWWGN